jgi:hypothetical protein
MMAHSKGWIGVDLDGTLVEYEGWKGAGHLGKPVHRMVERVRAWLEADIEVRIFTARVYVPPHPDLGRIEEAEWARDAIDTLCERAFGQVLPITCTKDFAMIELWDDRAVQVIPNTGLRSDGLD